MSNIQFTDNEVNLLRLHYLQEYNATLKKLQDVQTMLNKLGISSETTIAKPLPEKIVKIEQNSTVDTKIEEKKIAKIQISKPTKKIKIKEPKESKEEIAPAKRPYVKRADKILSPLDNIAPRKSKVAKVKKISWRKAAEKILKTENKFMRASSIYDIAVQQNSLDTDNRKKDMQALQTTLYQLAKIKGELHSRKVGTSSEYGLITWDEKKTASFI